MDITHLLQRLLTLIFLKDQTHNHGGFSKDDFNQLTQTFNQIFPHVTSATQNLLEAAPNEVKYDNGFATNLKKNLEELGSHWATFDNKLTYAVRIFQAQVSINSL